MSQTEGSERILTKMVDWGAGRHGVRSLAVVGSRAHSDRPADPWSNLDLDSVLMARRPKRYLDKC